MIVSSGCFVSKDEVAERSDYDGDGVGLGEDCDDGDATVGMPITWYADVDGDGFGGGEEQSGCPNERPGTNTADTADDCDDSNPSAYPGAEERYYDGVDQDCAGEDSDGNGSIDDFDQDSDGYENDVDCDDLDASLRPDPSIEEVAYDGIDNDCDLTTGDGDRDRDGHWSVDYSSKAPGSSLSPPSGQDGDCYDDVDDPEQPVDPLNDLPALPPENVFPGAPEDVAYDGIDAACDGDDNEFDADGDGFESAAYADRADTVGADCQDCLTDCDGEEAWTSTIDSADIHPDALEEFYDGVDQDCAGKNADDNAVEDDYDQDGDNHVADGYTDSLGNVGDDCLDTDARLAPGFTDLPSNGLDEDCGGENDYDLDLDGYVPDVAFGLPTVGVPGSETAPAGDCVDDPTLDSMAGAGEWAEDYNPAQHDTWGDGSDHDCAGNDDYDQDGDGYRSEDYAEISNLTTYQQWMVAVPNEAAKATDCDDNDNAISPGVSEVAGNAIDDNCDDAGAPEGIHGINTPSAHHSGAVVGDYGTGFGLRIAAGDLDGDGVAEVIVCDPSYDGLISNAGRATWYSGADVLGSELDASDYAGVVNGEENSDLLGYGRGVGDVTGDGVDDLLVGAVYADYGGTTGSAFVFAGPLTSTASSPASLGWSDADVQAFGDGGLAGLTLGVGEVTGDTVAELVVAAPYTTTTSAYEGLLYIWEVGSSGPIIDHSAATTVYGDTTGGFLGYSAVDVFDLDGDGVNEIIAASAVHPTSTGNSGIVYALKTPVTGPSFVQDITLAQITGGEETASCGHSIASGDYNDDGHVDIAVGCPGADNDAGGVAVFFGSPSPPDTATYSEGDLYIKGDADIYPERLGYSVAIGDVTGDGADDLVAGGLYYTPSTTDYYAGRVAMYESGSSGTLSGDQADGMVVGDGNANLVGYDIVADQDFDGDGIVDVLIGRGGTNLGGNSYGDVLLFTGGEW